MRHLKMEPWADRTSPKVPAMAPVGNPSGSWTRSSRCGGIPPWNTPRGSWADNSQNFYYKVAILVLQSRLNLAPAGGKRADGKKTNKWVSRHPPWPKLRSSEF